MRFGRSIVKEIRPCSICTPGRSDPDHPRLDLPRRIRLTHYVNLKSTAQRLERLLGEFAFAPMQEVLDVC